MLEWGGAESSEGRIFLKMSNFGFCKQVDGNVFVVVRYSKSTSFLFFS